MRNVCICASVVLLLCMSGSAEEKNEWGPNFDRVLDHVASNLEQHGFDHVLLVVNEHRSSEPVDESTLSRISTRLQELLSTEDREITPLADAVSLTFLNREKLKQLLEEQQADAVLVATYLSRKNGNSLRLVLLTEDRTLFVKRIRQTDPTAKPDDVPDQKPQANQGEGRSQTGSRTSSGATQTRRPGEPRTFSGSSGYQFERPRPPGQREGRREPPAPELPKDPPSDEVGNATGYGKDILEFALDNIGRQVGNGQCWTLAAEALEYAGAAPPNMYDFGDEVPLTELKPGDILQFKRARFEYGNSYAWMGMPDHTAVVRSVNGSTISILHQNFGQKIVTEFDINFQNMTKGSAIGYRPVSP